LILNNTTTKPMEKINQTAVEWLVQEINARGPIGEDIPTWLKELYEQAKAMEKEQIIQAITKTIIGSNVIYDNEYPEVIHTAEQYYKEIYESKTNL